MDEIAALDAESAEVLADDSGIAMKSGLARQSACAMSATFEQTQGVRREPTSTLDLKTSSLRPAICRDLLKPQAVKSS